MDLEPESPGRQSCAVLIPAFNEAASVAGVVSVALAARLGTVLVVDDGSSDSTASTSRIAGASVLRLAQNQGKGGAVAAGAAVLTEPVILLLDADLIGLTPEHLHDLADPVIHGNADMSRGVFEGGRWSTTAAQQLLPQLNGQRAIRRELLLGLPELSDSRYGIEMVITEAARAEDWRTVDVPMPGVSQVTKEEKLGFLKGLRQRLRMYRDIVRAMVSRQR